MKIDRVDIYVVPNATGTFHPVILEITCDDGTTGIGEAGVAYGIGGKAAASMVQELAQRLIIGRDPSQIELLWSEMYDHSFWAKGGGGTIVFAAMSAIEQALWDIKGKRLGAPVYDLLGGRVVDKLPVYNNAWYGSSNTPDEFARAAERPLKDGYKALKLYPLAVTNEKGSMRHVSRRMVDRGFIDVAAAKVKATRDAAGAGIEIMLDLSGGLTTDETIRFCEKVEQYDISWIEEPADPFDDGALARIASKISMPIAAGERIYGRGGYRRILEPQSVDILQPDVGTCGGLMEAKKIAAMGEAYNTRVAPHNCGSALSTAIAVQLSASLPNFMTLEVYPYLPERPGYVQVLENSPENRIKDGYLPLDDTPGLGVTLAHERLRPYLFAQCQ